MPEQNTNRLWFVLFTVLIGAILIFTYNDGAQATAQNIFDHLNGLLSGDVISADEREDLELVTDEDGNSYVELNEGHFASKNKVSVWLKVVKVMSRDNPDEITGYEIVDAGTSIDNIKSGNGSTSIKDAGISDIDFNITIGGLPVVSIGSSAFKDAGLSGDINLGDVTSVGSDAFAGSTLDGKLIGEKVSSIGSGAFSNANFSNSQTPNLQIVGPGNDSSIIVPDKEPSTTPSETKPSDSNTSSSSSESTTPSGPDAEKDIEKNVSSEPAEKGSAIYANIRGSYIEASKTYSDVWVELVKEDNGWLVNEAGNAKAVFSDGKGLSGEISFDILIDGLPIVRVADGVFQNASFSGEFRGNNLTEIGSGSFKNSVFTGSVQLPNVTKLGSNAFESSKFTGFFEANSLTDLGSYVFNNSSFKKGFYADKLRKVYVGTFPKAQFSEQISPLLQVVLQDNGNLKAVPRNYDVNGNIVVAQDGNDAVVNLRPAFMDDDYNVQPDIYAAVTYNSDIAGWIITSVGSEVNNKGEVITSLNYKSVGDISFNQTINDVPIKKINKDVFTSVVFSGDFYGDYLIEVTADQFRSSKFSGDLSLPNTVTIGSSAFSSSLFTGSLNVPKVKLLDISTFTLSAFNKDINAPVLYSVSDNVMPLASFTSQSTANLVKVGKNNGNLKANDRDYDVTGNIESEKFGSYTVVNIRPAYTENGVVYPDIWANLAKTDTGYTIISSGTTRLAAASTSDITSSNQVGGTISFDQTIDGLPITQISNDAFRSAKFTGNFYGSNLTSIGSYGLYSSAFTGDFYGDNLRTIGNYALSLSKFDGQFHGRNLITIGSMVFYRSPFIGDLNLPNVTSIGIDAFSIATFDGNLNIPKLTNLALVFGGFSRSTNVSFKGKLTADVLTSVANNTFGSNTQFSEQYVPNLVYVGTNNGNVIATTDSYTIDGNISSSYDISGSYVANIRPAYSDSSGMYLDVWVKLTKDSTTGGWNIVNAGSTKDTALGTSDFTSTNKPTGTISFNQTIDGLPITGIADSVFKYSEFTGDFYGDNLRTIGNYAFLQSKFDGQFHGRNLITIGSMVFYRSPFIGDLNLPNVTSIGIDAFSIATFDGNLNIPKLTNLALVFGGFSRSTNVSFKGKLTANVLTKVANNTLGSNTQFSEQYTPKLTTIGTNNGNLKQSN